MRVDRRPARGDDGFTLIESAMVCVTLAMLMAITVPTVTFVYQLSTTVRNTYNAVDQLALASEVVTRYVHEAVANASGGTPFISATADTATFYSDTGNANGPEKLVAQVVTAANGNRSFKLTITPAQAVSGVTTCPTVASPGNTCSYGASPDGYVLINYLTNGTGGNPVFSYDLQGGGTCAGPPPATPTATLNGALTKGQVVTQITLVGAGIPRPVASGDAIVLGTGSTAQTVVASAAAAQGATTISVNSYTTTAAVPTGTSVYDNACTPAQVATISAVSITMQATENPDGQATGFQALAYLLSPTFSLTEG